jgi:6-pyruvoyltetrahydropterin/6-carboxytetrahydropterin synthase
MFQVTREFTFAFAHRLPHATAKERMLHGHNGKISVTLAGESLNAIGMVMDFVEMKRHIGQWLDEQFDHATLLQRDDPLVRILQAAEQRVLVLDVAPTPENLARLVYERCRRTGLPVVEVTMWEAANRYATYRGAATG